MSSSIVYITHLTVEILLLTWCFVSHLLARKLKPYFAKDQYIRKPQFQ